MVSEQIVDGSFEINDPAWVFETPYSWRTTEYYHSGSWSMASYSDPFGFYQTMNVDVDSITNFTLWSYYASPAGNSTVTLTLTYSDSTTSDHSFNAAVPDRQVWTKRTITPTAGKTLSRITFASGTENPFYIDDVSLSGSHPTPGPGLYDADGNLLLLGSFFTRVLETRTTKYSAYQFPSINKEFLQSLGLKNRLFFIEALGTGSASAPTDRTVVENSAILIPGQDGFILTRLMSDLLPVTFLNVEAVDTGGRPAELKIIIHAVERITGSA